MVYEDKVFKELFQGRWQTVWQTAFGSVLDVIKEVKSAEGIEDITDCTRLVGYHSVYRIRIGNYRAFFTFHIEIVDDVVYFRYLVSRGQAYTKKVEKELMRLDD